MFWGSFFANKESWDQRRLPEMVRWLGRRKQSASAHTDLRCDTLELVPDLGEEAGPAAGAHLNAAGGSRFKMQAPGWTVAIQPLALSVLASDTGRWREREKEGWVGVTYFHFALGCRGQRRCLSDIWEKRKWKSDSGLGGGCQPTRWHRACLESEGGWRQQRIRIPGVSWLTLGLNIFLAFSVTSVAAES